MKYPAVQLVICVTILEYALSSQIKAKGTLMEMVGADWLRSDKREDDLGGRPGGIVQVSVLFFAFCFVCILYRHLFTCTEFAYQNPYGLVWMKSILLLLCRNMLLRGVRSSFLL